MSVPPGGPRLEFQADLQVVVDGVEAQVDADGREFRITTAHPAQLLRHAVPLVRTVDRGRLRSALSAVNAQGVGVRVVGPRGEVLRFGGGVAPRVLRVPLAPATAGIAAAALVAVGVVIRRAVDRG